MIASNNNMKFQYGIFTYSKTPNKIINGFI